MINLDEAKRWADFLGDKHSFVNLQHRKGAAEMIRALIAKVQELESTIEHQRSRKPLTEEQSTAEHVSSPECWCHPELNYVDPVTGAEVWVHKELQ